MIRSFILTILGILFLGWGVVFAATDGFIVRTLVGDDLNPPSIPTGLTATPIATSQINLSWASSSDDYILSGYYVFRDNVQIATTTETFYADVGLTATTTYTYYVTAFDYFNNVSGSSTLVATTTLGVIVPPATPSSGPLQGSKGHLSELLSLQILPSQTGAVIRYETKEYIRAVIQWGITTSYEGGTSAERSFTKYHETHIDDLKPGTRYQLLIKGETQSGMNGVLTQTSFMTLPAEDTIPPGNVSNLQATSRGEDAILTWENPIDLDFDHVRIVRSDRFYPTDDVDGWVVYEGEGRMVVDEGALIDSRKAYYTVFTYDERGNVSSGAVIALAGDTVVPPPLSYENEIQLSFEDLHFYQDNEELTLKEKGVYEINGGQYLTISIPYEKLPEHLKTILVTIAEKENPEKTFTFLLRINKEKTAYTARLAPFSTLQEFTVRISVFDYTTAQIGYTEGELHSTISSYLHEDSDSTVGPLLLNIQKFFSENYLSLFVALLALLFLLASRILRVRE